jgi:hypothetical protein
MTRGTEQYGDPWQRGSLPTPRSTTRSCLPSGTLRPVQASLPSWWEDDARVTVPSLRPFGPRWMAESIRTQKRVEIGHMTHYCAYHDIYNCWFAHG